MRGLKFRGRHKDTGEWVYGWLVKDWDGGAHIITEFGPNITGCCECGANGQTSFVVDPETVGQSTGLKDKNRWEVYEGDVVKGKRFLNGTEHRFIGEVVYVPPKFCINGVGKYQGLIHEKLDGAYEVIGNIYEHPHLLEANHA